jgi:Spy/CpxP family protein refolding chaperone
MGLQGENDMKKLTSFVGIAALVLGVAFLTVAHAAPKAAPAPAAAATAAQPAPNATPAPDPQGHPEIHAALEALRNARAHIHDAAHDFHGHREAALHAVDAAINQLNICMQYDR